MTTHIFVRAIRSSVLAATVAFALVAPALAVDQGTSSSSDSSSSSSSSGFDVSSGMADARRLINRGDFAGAVEALKPVIGADANNADALNLMGFALRKSGDIPHALGFYRRALSVNPNHKGANEYLGELYVETGEMDLARERLAELERICGNTTCEEYEDLAEAIGN
jgi:tetratricopeptide (TPR) repeat protein